MGAVVGVRTVSSLIITHPNPTFPTSAYKISLFRFVQYVVKHFAAGSMVGAVPELQRDLEP